MSPPVTEHQDDKYTGYSFIEGDTLNNIQYDDISVNLAKQIVCCDFTI